MAGHNLYIYLRGGRGDAFVTDSWDGQLPDEEGLLDLTTGAPVVVTEEDETRVPGVEVSEPYRDIFTPLGSTLVYHVQDSGVLNVPTSSALIYDTPTVTSPNYVPVGYGNHPGSITVAEGGIRASNSDEINHVKPRQFLKVCTWLMFTEVEPDEEGAPTPAIFKFRKADVIGWGKHARL